MNDDIENVQNNFGVFMTTMASLDADFHVAATVEDNGCINGSDLYIDNTFSASDAQATITTMINLGGSYGSNTERAFTLLEACLAEAVLERLQLRSGPGEREPQPHRCLRRA